ncbi:hypothetical protein BDN72DRAFT_74695 [Pluteus cervinus]|uniref:Uncharacterized protein n=1 Tax=Pluteus cervinus TaxID=181527 RepID=A0ACD3AQI9_9AGAR|nr:hypothetical protein BDN72DRAFT_74695 [Pluteus cervinus]
MSSLDDGTPSSSSAFASETRSSLPKLQIQIPNAVMTIPEVTQSANARLQTTQAGLIGSTPTQPTKTHPQRIQLPRGDTGDSLGRSTMTQYKTPVEEMPQTASYFNSGSPTHLDQSQSQRLSPVGMHDRQRSENDAFHHSRRPSPEQLPPHMIQVASATGFIRNPWTQEFEMSRNPYNFQLVPLRARVNAPKNGRQHLNQAEESERPHQKDVEAGVASPGGETGGGQQQADQVLPKNLGFNLLQVVYFLYRLLLLNLPEVYYYRVLRVYEESQPLDPDLSIRTSYSEPEVSFSEAWRGFVKALMKEWKTLNLVSALLLSAIFSMFQLPSISADPLTQSVALLSLICALISLLCGCLYIVRFGSMRRRVEAQAWFKEMTKVNPFIFWNGWILLSIPAVWLSWSIILFILSILCFLWRPRKEILDDSIPFNFSLGIRLSVSIVLALGAVYVSLVFWSFRRFESLSTLPETRAPSIMSEMRSRKTPHGSAPTSPRHDTSRKSSLLDNLFDIPTRKRDPNAVYPPFPTQKLRDDLVNDFTPLECPSVLEDHDVLPNWLDFIRVGFTISYAC